MQLILNLHDHFYEKAQKVKVECLSVGLRYTAVVTDDGGMGIAYTDVGNGHCRSLNKDYRDYEGKSASELLAQIKSPVPLYRSMGLALVNALNYNEACGLPEDSTDRVWMDDFGIGRESRVAMVGFFRPLMKLFKDRGALVEVIDDSHGVGDRSDFYRKLDGWAEVLLLTSTSILNNSTEEVLGRLGPGVKVIMIGPSTPMVGRAFSHLPVRILAGTVPVDKEGVLKAVRHGAGTPVIHRFSRKICLALDGGEKA
jgi:uncharacterized protein (DUF4213/DUF364 family)